MLRVLKNIFLIVAIVIIAISVLAEGIMNLQFRKSDKKILRKLEHQSATASVKYVNTIDRSVRVIELIRNDTLPFVIFVHGAPGSSADFFAYLEDTSLSKRFNLITYDRPGYGKSGFGKALVSIKEQAAALKEVVKLHTSRRIYLVAHSFGGPICLQMAIDFPGSVQGLILLAPAVDPDNEKILKIAHLARWPVFKQLTPTALKVAADEKFSHVEHLRKLAPYLSSLNLKIVHLHGTNDSLVPFANLGFLENKLKHSNSNFRIVVLPGEDHFLPWTQFELVKAEIHKLADSH